MCTCVNVTSCFDKCSRTTFFFLTDITGPIILQSYRVIADYEKNSKSELSVKDGDVIDVVEKTENGNLLFKEHLYLIS